ncbi:MAG TPA: hypothetical protein VGN12_06250 [Pirellulales bacterium]|jgi:hypothetical protein
MSNTARRRWLQFSITGLLALMSVTALCLTLVHRGKFDQRTNVQFAQTPIWDVIDYLSNKHSFAWRADDPELAAAGILFYSRPTALTITDRVTDAPLGETLDRFLAPLGLGYFVENGELVVSTRAAAERAHSGLGALRQRFARLEARP